MAKIDHSTMDKYVDGKLVKKGKSDDSEQGERLNLSWWATEKPEEQAHQVAETIKFIGNHQASRLEQLTVSTRLYGANSAFGLLGTSFTRASSVNTSPMSQRISYNLVSSVVDTLVAKLAKKKINPTFVTNGGDWEIQQRAEDLSKFVEGCFYQTKWHKRQTVQARDGIVWGTGINHIFAKRGKIAVERCYPHEFMVDLVESLSLYPTQLHRIKIAERGRLLADPQFKSDEDQAAILRAMPANFQELGGTGTAADLVILSDSYHLPSDPDAGPEDTDGRHVICVGDQNLCSDPYLKDYYPFVFFNYVERLLGFWGQGAPERLQNLQGEVNRLMLLDQKSRWMMASFKVLLENNSKIVSQHLNNDVGTLIRYHGTPPQYVTPPAIDASNEAKINALIQMGYKQEGVSELEASSIKPLGVNSGKALRTMTDISAERQEYLEQEIESCALEAARQMIEVAKDIYKEKKSYKVAFPSTKFVETIDWKDIKLKDDEYVMKSFPASSLSDDLTGRLEDITEYMQAGVISPRAGRRLLRKPDLEMADALDAAPEDLLHKIFEQMLKKGESTPPEPDWDLQLAQQLGLLYISYGTFHNCPDERVQLIRDFLTQVHDLLNPQPAPEQMVPQPGPVPGAGVPQAVPQAPPVSDILPTTPQPQAA